MRCALGSLLSITLLGAVSGAVGGGCASTRGPATTRGAEPSASAQREGSRTSAIPVLRGPGAQHFGAVRAEVARLSLEHTSVRLAAVGAAGAVREDVLQLPLTKETADVTTLVVVAIFHGRVRVGALETRADGALYVATGMFASLPGTVALLRVDDEADLDDVLRVSTALRDRGIEGRVLGSVAPTEPAPNAWGSSCHSPLAGEPASDGIVVKVLVDDDGGGRAGVVHVLGTPPAGFAWAAAVCATLNRFEASTAAAGRPRIGRPLAINFLP